MTSLLKSKKNFGASIGAKRGAANSVITRIRSRWSKFRDLVPLLASRGLHFVIRLERNDAKIFRWMCNELKTKVKLELKFYNECLQNRKTPLIRLVNVEI